MRGGIRGTQALLLAPAPSVPATRAIVSRRLADHVHGFLVWLEHALARSPNTVKSYSEDVRMFVAFCEHAGIEYVEHVTFHHVEAFGASLRAHLGQKESSIARRYSALRKFFLYLERHELVPKNPAKLALPMKQPPPRIAKHMTKVERNRILAALAKRDSHRGRRNYAMFSLMFLSGLRVSEVCLLKVEDVDLAEATLAVEHSKGDKPRLVPIPPRLVRILRGWITCHRPRGRGAVSPWLFVRVGGTWPGRDGEPLNPKAIYHQVRRKIEPLLGRRVTPHSFRHSYGTHIWEESGDQRLTQHLMGHASPNTTARYLHVTPKHERARLAEYLK